MKKNACALAPSSIEVGICLLDESVNVYRQKVNAAARVAPCMAMGDWLERARSS
jgi:hypothetical protein